MVPVTSVALFALGAIIASFVGVVVARYATGQSIVSGRSRCDACGAPLSGLALVPILSYAFLRGRARCCGARVSPFSTIAEALLGTLYVLLYGVFGLTLTLLVFALAITALLALVEYDLMHQIVPPPFLAVFMLFAVLAGYLSAPTLAAFGLAALVALVMGVLFALLHFLSGGRLMGLSDAPVVFALALMTGPAAIPGFAFSFWIGAVIGIGILLARPAGSRMGIEVPLVPFLAAGFLLAFFTAWNPFSFVALIPYA